MAIPFSNSGDNAGMIITGILIVTLHHLSMVCIFMGLRFAAKTLKSVEFAFDSFLPIPIERNGKPVLLINIILPNSDAVDEYLVSTFNKTEYVLEKDNRIASK